MRQARIAAFALALTVFGGGIRANPSDASDICALNHISVDQAIFKVSVADNNNKRAHGLMNVTEMPDWAGMLFVFPITSEVSFWMKNTLIPLDMIFMDEDGEILKVYENAQPHDLMGIKSDFPVKYVLEVNGGISQELGINVGDRAISLEMGNCTP